jgi:hypothetical protein
MGSQRHVRGIGNTDSSVASLYVLYADSTTSGNSVQMTSNYIRTFTISSDNNYIRFRLLGDERAYALFSLFPADRE